MSTTVVTTCADGETLEEALDRGGHGALQDAPRHDARDRALYFLLYAVSAHAEQGNVVDPHDMRAGAHRRERRERPTRHRARSRPRRRIGRASRRRNRFRLGPTTTGRPSARRDVTGVTKQRRRWPPGRRPCRTRCRGRPRRAARVGQRRERARPARPRPSRQPTGASAANTSASERAAQVAADVGRRRRAATTSRIARIEQAARDVVDDRRARRERAARDLGLRRVDRDARPARRQRARPPGAPARSSSAASTGVAPRARRLAADVERCRRPRSRSRRPCAMAASASR